MELFEGVNPVSKVKMPKVNNQRLRYLTREEAELVLDSSHGEVHDAALLSLFSGMRLGECVNLLWNDIDFERGTITIRDSKNGSSRVVFMHPRVKETFLIRPRASARVFRILPHSLGTKFRKVIDSLGLNDGIDAVRQRVVFHTLRHTFCSWQAEMGTSIQVIKELAGHKTLSMTMRYAHLSDQTLRAAVNAM
jgi:integrase